MGCDAQLASGRIFWRYPVEVCGTVVWVVWGEFLGNLSVVRECVEQTAFDQLNY